MILILIVTHFDPNLTFKCKFDGIRNEVDQYLLQPPLIGFEFLWHVLLLVNDEFDAFCLHLKTKHILNLREAGFKREVLFYFSELTILEHVDIEHILHQIKQ